MFLLNERMQGDGDLLLMGNLDMCPNGTYILMVLTGHPVLNSGRGLEFHSACART